MEEGLGRRVSAGHACGALGPWLVPEGREHVSREIVGVS